MHLASSSRRAGTVRRTFRAIAFATLAALAACTGQIAYFVDTVFTYEGKTYLIQEFLFAEQRNTTLFELNGDERTFAGQSGGLALHKGVGEGATDVDIVTSVTLNARETQARIDEDEVMLRIIDIIRNGEQQGEPVIREQNALAYIGTEGSPEGVREISRE